MSTLYHDNFENDALGSIAPGWVDGSGANFVVSTNNPVSGTRAFGEAAFTNGHTAIYTGIAATADACVQASQVVQLDSNGYGANIGLSLRTDAAGGATGYYFLPDFHVGSVLLFKRVAGTYTLVNNTPMGISWTNGQKACLKAQVQGSTLTWKVWPATSAEPSAWTATAVDSSITTAGYAGVYCGSNNVNPGSTTCSFDDIFIGNAGTSFPTTVATALNVNLHTSPFNWAINSTTGQLLSINVGAELDIVAAATTQICLDVNVNAFSAASYPAASYPKIKYSIDGGPLTSYQLQPMDRVLNLATGLSSGTHTLQLWLMGLDVYGGNPASTPLTTKWSGANSLIINSILLDAGATLSTYTPPAKTWLALGDSITEGQWQLGNSNVLTNAVAYEDATTSHIALLANVFGAQICNVSFGGQSWTATFDSDIPPVPSTYNFIYNGVSRSFSAPPNYCSINLGANGTVTASTVASFLTTLRAACGNATQLILLVPFGGQNRSAITTAYNTYKGTSPTDNLILIDLNDSRFAGTYGTPTEYLSDGLHPTTTGQAIIAASLTRAISTTLAASSETGGGSGTTHTVGGGIFAGL
jgi:lysophospholipase L1-like esterase